MGGGIDDGARDVRLGVAQRDGAERHAAVHVTVPVDVDHAAARGLREVRWTLRVVASVERGGAFAPGGRSRRKDVSCSGAQRELVFRALGVQLRLWL